jgi:parallel beta-helix repeat protein
LTSIPTSPPVEIPADTSAQTATLAPLPVNSVLSISPGTEEQGTYITLHSGGDVDTTVVNGGSPATTSRSTGNGAAIITPDGNSVADYYIQFDIENSAFFDGSPTSSVRLDVEYLDVGIDAFLVEYDALSGGPYGDGIFKSTRQTYKTNTNRYKVATFILKDVRFADRDNGADLRISDLGDGAEVIRKVTITTLRIPTVINVDSCGANPFDENPDSDAIQECIKQARFGDIVNFTSGEKTPGYIGYRIDKTIFLETYVPIKYLTFTSTDSEDPALLKATADLKGFVIKEVARSIMQGGPSGEVDYITLSHLHIDGNRQERVCYGPNQLHDGLDDNWGSYLPNECTENGDPWCSPGSVDLSGAMYPDDPGITSTTNPEKWTSGVIVDSLYITNTECGTALGMNGADNVIMNTVIEIAGDHVHENGCALTDVDTDGRGGWSDGITFTGHNIQIIDNEIINPSDIGIVYFGGEETVIRNNTIRSTEGNYGAFGGIAIHPWWMGTVAFGQIINNTIENLSDERCGGLHTGINIGTHMWGGACIMTGPSALIGLSPCVLEPELPAGAVCTPGEKCQVWAHIPEGSTYTLQDNQVTGAHINYLVEGLDVVGTFIQSGNTSNAPRRTDWNAARFGCEGVTWGPTDFIAHHPSLDGWTDLRIHCER